MPGEVISDEKLNKIIEDIKNVIEDPVKLGKIDIKNVAFGLKGLDVNVAVPDSEGGLDPVVEILSKIKNVESVEVVDVGRI
jgi:translation elongation factor aEF-1 beta